MIILLAFGALGQLLSYVFVVHPKIIESASYSMVVEPGDTVYSVAQGLKEKGLISSIFLFKSALFLQGGKIQTGFYEIESSRSLWALAHVFSVGQAKARRVTITEGMRASDIAKLLFWSRIIPSQTRFLDLVDDEDFIAQLGLNVPSLEGFLFPNTYIISSYVSEEHALRTLVNQFFKEIKALGLSKQDFKDQSGYQTLVLASIVEKEYRLSQEAPLIASVFINRLQRNMRLQSCATLEYIITEELAQAKPKRITISDTFLPSAFNTYRKNGLPPRPISNPGKIALFAALNPAKTDYLFFVVKNFTTGEHRFTTNFNDHRLEREYLNNFYRVQKSQRS